VVSVRCVGRIGIESSVDANSDLSVPANLLALSDGVIERVQSFAEIASRPAGAV
jgi:hypothetical protein